MTKNNSGLKAAILTMSFIQMATNAVSSILANIATEFPDASVTTIQYLMTFPNLMIVAVSVIAAGLAERISKRTLAATGLLLAAVSGILSFAVHGSILILYVWAGMLGIGVGLVVPMANSLISDYFQENERDTMLGYRSCECGKHDYDLCRRCFGNNCMAVRLPGIFTCNSGIDSDTYVCAETECSSERYCYNRKEET